MIVKLLTEHHLEFVSLKGGCRGSSESTHVKMPHCWKSHALAHINTTWIRSSLFFSVYACIDLWKKRKFNNIPYCATVLHTITQL